MNEIEVGVIEVIAVNSRYSADEIAIGDPLDKFISSFWADRLAREVARKFEGINSTLLTNKLFTEIKLVSQLIDFVKSYYS